jgi:hypothetical protein
VTATATWTPNTSTLTDLLEKIIESQKRNPSRKVLLILDDCIPIISMKNKAFQTLASQSRHLGISCLIALQHLKYCPPICRDSTRTTFILKSGANNVKALFDMQQKYSQLKDWERYVERNTGQYKIIRSEDELVVFRLPPETRTFYIAYGKQSK